MSKALQADAREELLRKADEAIYARRNSAVEQERKIKENELNTEIAVQQKQRQVRETQMAAEIAVEEQRATLVDHKVQNERKEAEARAQGGEAEGELKVLNSEESRGGEGPAQEKARGVGGGKSGV